MKDCYGNYSYKGWFIFFSEAGQLWEIQPTEKIIENFVINLNEEKYNLICDEWYNEWYNEDLNTLSKTKKYIKENEDKLMTKLKALINNLDLC